MVFGMTLMMVAVTAATEIVKVILMKMTATTMTMTLRILMLIVAAVGMVMVMVVHKFHVSVDDGCYDDGERDEVDKNYE